MKKMILVLGVLVAGFGWAAEPQETPIRVLVSSDRPDYAQSLVSILNERGAKAEAGPVDDASLARADVAVLFGSGFQPYLAERRAAIEAFAARGGGLVLLHGAIAAGSADWWKPLAGGAWTASSRRFASRMMLYVASGQHPIVRDAWSFDVDDETVYDLDVADGLQVLASAFTPKITGRRDQADRPGQADRANIYDLQPQMWAYEGRTHRAFVELQGDPRTLAHASHRAFTLRAISWAARRNDLDRLCSREELTAIRYPEGGPSRPSDTPKQMEVHPDFTVTTIASEPLINKPIAINWDARGRLWIAETPEYPNGRRPTVAAPWKETGSLEPGHYDRPGRDRICILTDSKGDGIMDTKTVFYEGLELVTGFCFYGDGVLALNQPDLLWIRDTDGDGKADKVERILTGFTPGDSHFVANHLIAAPDGWIYLSMGGQEDIRTPDRKTLLGRASSGIFRVKPDGSALEQVSSKGGNGFGAHITSDFEMFFGQATSGNPLQHVVVPEWTLAAGRMKNLSGAYSVINGRKVVRRELPSRAPLMQIDVVGGYSAACAALVYEGGAWPEAWNRATFVTEPILNVIHTEKMRAAGPTLNGEMVRTDAEFIYSRDYWFRPIDVATGPDGAIYILDFYSPVIAHSDTRGPQHSRAGASVRPDRDHYFGRIYRVQHKQAKTLVVPDLEKAGVPELAAAFRHPNDVVRSNAFRLLIGKKGADVAAALEKLAADESFIPARLLGLWGLYRVGALKPEELRAALKSPVAEVRKTAALIVEAGAIPGLAPDLAANLEDPDPRARIAMMRGLARSAWTEDIAAKLLALYPALEDDWTRSAAIAAVADPATVLSAALKSDTSPAHLPLLLALARRMADRRDAAAFVPLLEAAAAAPPRADGVKAVLLEAAAALTSAPPDSAGLQTALRTLLQSGTLRLSAGALPIAAAWGTSADLKADVARRVALALARAGDEKASEESRMLEVTALAGARSADPEILPALGRVLSGGGSPALKRHTLAALGSTADPRVGPMLLDVQSRLDPASQDASFTLLLSRRDWILTLLQAIDAKTVTLAQLGPNNVFRLRSHPDKELAQRAAKTLDAISKPSTNKDALIASLLPEVIKPGSPARGREVFQKTCAACHKFNDLGNQIGPVLTGMGAHGPEFLLVNIVDPNRSVDAGYEAWNVATKNGSILSGILGQENDAVMVLKTATGPIEIPKSEIVAAKKSSLSLMPEGLEALGAEALRDVIAFLCEGAGNYRVLDLSGAFTTDTRRGLFHSAAALRDTLHFRAYGLVQVEGVPFNLIDPSKSSLGGNLIVLRGGGEADYAFGYPRQVEVKVGAPVKSLRLLGGVAGWGAPEPKDGPTILTLSLFFQGGAKEVVELKDGVHFLDYPSNGEVPGSKRAEGVMSEGQIRVITVPVTRSQILERIVLSSPGHGTTAATAAITAELAH